MGFHEEVSNGSACYLWQKVYFRLEIGLHAPIQLFEQPRGALQGPLWDCKSWFEVYRDSKTMPGANIMFLAGLLTSL